MVLNKMGLLLPFLNEQQFIKYNKCRKKQLHDNNKLPIIKATFIDGIK